jgi:hypothetical protein
MSSTTNVDDQATAEQSLAQSTEEVKENSNENVSTDRALEAALQEAVRAEADSQSQNGDEIDMDDSYAPDPTQLAPVMPSDRAEEDNRSAEYSPGLHRNVPDVPDRESDDYEPPDATALSDVLESPPFSPAPPESIHELAGDTIQDVNPTQAIDEGGQNATKKTHSVLNSSPQQPLEVKCLLVSLQRSEFADDRLEWCRRS